MAATTSNWTAKITTPEYTREFEVMATSVGPSAHVAVIREHHVVATFDAAVTIYRDRFTGRISKVLTTGAGQTGEHRTIKGSLEDWAGQVAFEFVRQMSH